MLIYFFGRDRVVLSMKLKSGIFLNSSLAASDGLCSFELEVFAGATPLNPFFSPVPVMEDNLPAFFFGCSGVGDAMSTAHSFPVGSCIGNNSGTLDTTTEPRLLTRSVPILSIGATRPPIG
jgi:hypothetical protein